MLLLRIYMYTDYKTHGGRLSTCCQPACKACISFICSRAGLKNCISHEGHMIALDQVHIDMLGMWHALIWFLT